MFHRILLVIAFLAAVGVSWHTTRRVEAADSPDLRRYDRARGAMRTLLDRHPALFTARERERIAESVMQLQMASGYWTAAADTDTSVIMRSRGAAEGAMARLVTLLDASPAVDRVDVQSPSPARRHSASGSGVVLFRVARPGAVAEAVPDFIMQEVDFAAGVPAIDCGAAQIVYGVVLFDNASTGVRNLKLTSRGREIAALPLEITVPPPGRLKVEIVDGALGRFTPAVAALYDSAGQLVIPPQALSFDHAGFRYNEPPYRQKQGRSRNYEQSSYWPGEHGQRKAFFVDGGFEMDLAEGEYTLIAGKGFEYTPVVSKVAVRASAARVERVRLQRWIDMPSRGWYSGDGHVHYARPSAEANRDLMVWTQAEDVHVANVMRMGDALKTYFEQYAYGKSGRHIAGDYALVPGQEDPRTIGMGHTLHMNLLSPFRIGEQYYLYDVVFDETRRQGGLTGYAHAYQPPAMGFFVRQDMSLNVAGGRVDFAEISEFGDIDTKLYYEFLNLGFPLTASAGSDVPWGHSVGTSRVYAYTGGAFHVDEWFRAVKNGHTFVTTGPMLELTVSGRIPGSRITARAGETLRVEARALGGPVPPRYLEIVVQGDVARSVSGAQRELSLEWRAPVTGSTWIAARAAGAATSPVYVEVGGRRTWKLSQVEELIENRMQQLLDIETLIKNGTPAGRDGTWNNPEALKKQGPLLARRVVAAREIYEKLRLEARQQRALSN